MKAKTTNRPPTVPSLSKRSPKCKSHYFAAIVARLLVVMPALCMDARVARPQSEPPDWTTAVRTQILQHWFQFQKGSNYPVSYIVDFDLDPTGKLIGRPKVVAKSNFSMPPSTTLLEDAVTQAQPFFMLDEKDYGSWKHVTTTFRSGDKDAVDIYAFTKKDILGLTTGMSEADARQVLQAKSCRVSKPDAQIMECVIDANHRFRVRSTANLSPNVVTEINYFFRSGEIGQAMIDSVSAQFRTRRWGPNWILADGVTMSIAIVEDNYRDAPLWELSIIQNSLMNEDRAALDAKARAAFPKPKF
ncbi:hypothetical protein [Bradyrhizobium sp. CCGUVB14]|uniref:hypothetical protein n=1 Tax=Bradyrhizobium sp. CCGUVB14 TaxID=2949628 RepID=UPI0020B1E72A|nr:hypothetical protein [Bradyrhizobium sp. CCGUVB14]MCP3441986.1 hypothetical protein [Bradyrhizobium sp. CCGUVB14]